MKLFASDLDKTLIHSYKTAQPGDICVELKDGKKLSYMTHEAQKTLRNICSHPDIAFTPVTTRSTEQYERIHLFDNYVPHLAAAANGGVLLIDGESDKEWYAQSQQLIRNSLPVMDEGMRILEKDPDVSFEIRIVDGMFVFTKSGNTDATKKRLSDALDKSQVMIYNIGEKIYIFPAVLTKGRAVERLVQRFGFTGVICAGDSEFDISMLEIADIAYYPLGLAEYVSSKNGIGFDETHRRFADSLLEDFEKRCYDEVGRCIKDK
ncbi:MAG: HAD hydrolase family protein [Oscillospiraceae bacterium]|nr:HAD hydrolase family protein [Oscillospiraceae bacterium]